MAKEQRSLTANALQHCCDQDIAFYPLPDFKAEKFKREGQFLNWISILKKDLFSGDSLDSDLGFNFGLMRRGERKLLMGLQGGCNEAGAVNMAALRELYKVRTEDAKQLQDNLHLSLELELISTTRSGVPS